MGDLFLFQSASDEDKTERDEKRRRERSGGEESWSELSLPHSAGGSKIERC